MRKFWHWKIGALEIFRFFDSSIFRLDLRFTIYDLRLDLRFTIYDLRLDLGDWRIWAMGKSEFLLKQDWQGLQDYSPQGPLEVLQLLADL